MKILAVGAAERCQELKEKISAEHLLDTDDSVQEKNLVSYDLIFDLNLDEHSFPESYCNKKEPTIIGCAVKKTLREMIYGTGPSVDCTLIGMNLLPTFIDRPKVEISILKKTEAAKAHLVMKELNWDYLLVEDRVGMVTPRVICMLINEACYTLEEGTASLQDIDKAMKLGGNYPYGPFEWCDLIGINDVYETLDAVWNDGHNERHKICPLMKSMYLDNEKFYSQL